MHLAAERSTDPGRKGAELARQVLVTRSSLRSRVVPTYMGAWRRQGRRPGGSESARMIQGLRAYRARRRATAALAIENTVEGCSLTQGP